MNFSDLNLIDPVKRAIEDLGFVAPTEIQALALPKLLDDVDRDFIGQAQTGTGKTLAFVLPLIQKLNARDKNIQALVLEPTRELAKQVNSEVEKLGKYTKFKSTAVYGGAPYEKQIKALRHDKPQIVVGTPGRIIDLMDRGVLNLADVQYFVLDEADEMLDMGFFDDVQKIVETAINRKAFWMFSATMPKPILKLIADNFDAPEIVHVEKKTLSNEDIEQLYYIVNLKNFEDAVCRLLDITPDMYGIVFCNTKKETWSLTESLLTKGYLVEGLHGDMGQEQRERAMNRFKSGRTRILICTDVAARGIDINNLTHVINYGLPRDIESYVHRIGRTGRAGMKGTAISLIDPRDIYLLKRVEQFTRKKMTKARFPSGEELKMALLKKELEKTTNLVEAVLSKGEDFKIDPLFNEFENFYKRLNREQLLMIMFSTRFNKMFRKLTEMAELDVPEPKRDRKKSSGHERTYRAGRSPRSKNGNAPRTRRNDDRRGRSQKNFRNKKGR